MAGRGVSAMATGRNIKQLVQESPKSTIKVAPVDKDKGGRGPETKLGKFKAEMKAMLKEFGDNLTGRINEMETKFTGMFKDYQNEMEVLRQDVTDTKIEVTEMKGKVDGMTEKVDNIEGIETSLDYYSNELEDLKDQQKGKIKETKDYIDKKVAEINRKLLIMEKQDRKYNLIADGTPEDNDENMCAKMRDIFCK